MALPILQLGSQSEYVTQLRAQLTKLGFAISMPTSDASIYDSAVQYAVSSFQAKVGLQADGVVGPDTWTKLGAQDTGGPATGPGWGKLLLMAVVAGGVWWWWKKRKPYGEFSSRGKMSQYGDAIDISLIEEPLLLMERGDCNGAARLLMKRRTYVSGASSPKNSRIFKDVARRVVIGCGREVEPLVREAIKLEEREARYPNVMTDLEQKMRAKRKMVRRGQDESDLAPYIRSQPSMRRGTYVTRDGSMRHETHRLYPDTRGSRGGKVVYVNNSGQQVTGRTVGQDSPASSVLLVEGPDGRRETIHKSKIRRFLPHYGPKQAERAGKVLSPEQKAAQAVRSRETRAKATALRKEADRLELEMMRRVDPKHLRTATTTQRELWAKRGRN